MLNCPAIQGIFSLLLSFEERRQPDRTGDGRPSCVQEQWQTGECSMAVWMAIQGAEEKQSTWRLHGMAWNGNSKFLSNTASVCIHCLADAGKPAAARSGLGLGLGQ